MHTSGCGRGYHTSTPAKHDHALTHAYFFKSCVPSCDRLVSAVSYFKIIKQKILAKRNLKKKKKNKTPQTGLGRKGEWGRKPEHVWLNSLWIRRGPHVI